MTEDVDSGPVDGRGPPDVGGDHQPSAGPAPAGHCPGQHHLALTRAVLDVGTRTDGERVACEGLVDGGDCWRAWVGDRTLDGDRLAVRTVATEDDGVTQRETAAAPTVATDADAPWVSALDDDVVRVDSVDPGVDRPWDRAADGREPVAAAPVGHGGTVHGVLVAHAEPGSALGGLERESLRSLAAALGSVVDASRARELLFADAVVELEFHDSDRESPLVRTAAEHGCTLTVESQVSVDDGWLLYCAVDGADPDAVAGTLHHVDGVVHCRSLPCSDDDGRLEVATDGVALPAPADAPGTTLVDSVAEAGRCRTTVEIPRSAETRETIARLRTAHPDLQLVACRECERSPTTGEAPGGLLDPLSDRQRDVVETLYRAGYFQWPRESTAEDVAEELSIAPSTLHGHLRKAQNHLLSGLFD